jgi:hypothetical protein
MPVDEDTGTLNRVTIGTWHRESARQNIKTLLVTKPKFLFYVHLDTSGVDRDGIRSPALRTFQNNTPRKAKELFLPSRRIRLITQHYHTLLHSAVFTNKVVTQLFLSFVEVNTLWPVSNTIPAE